MSTSSPKWSRKYGRRAAGASALALAALLAGCGDPPPDGGSVIGPPPPTGWGAPTTLASALSADPRTPAAAIDGSGQATVLWPQSESLTSSRLVVNARVNTAASGWAPVEVADALSVVDTAADAITGLQAIAPATGTAALWARQRSTAGDGVRSADRAAAGWAVQNLPPFPVSAGIAISEPVIAALDNGLQAAAWVQEIGGVPQVVLTVRRVGAGGFGWVVPARVQSDPSQRGAQPALAIDRNGLVMLVWRQGTPGRIWSITFDTSGVGSFGVLNEVNGSVLGDMRNPRVVAAGLGRFLATWEQQDGGGFYSLLARSGTALDWQGNALPVDTRSESVSGSLLLVGPNETAISAWQQAGGLYGARWTAASGLWTQPQQIGATLVGTSSDLRAAADAAGNLTAVWLQRDVAGAPADVYTASVPVGVAPLEPVLLDSESGEASAPALAVNAAGAAVAAWLQAQPGQANASLIARVLR